PKKSVCESFGQYICDTGPVSWAAAGTGETSKNPDARIVKAKELITTRRSLLSICVRLVDMPLSYATPTSRGTGAWGYATLFIIVLAEIPIRQMERTEDVYIIISPERHVGR